MHLHVRRWQFALHAPALHKPTRVTPIVIHQLQIVRPPAFRAGVNGRQTQQSISTVYAKRFTAHAHGRANRPGHQGNRNRQRQAHKFEPKLKKDKDQPGLKETGDRQRNNRQRRQKEQIPPPKVPEKIRARRPPEGGIRIKIKRRRQPRRGRGELSLEGKMVLIIVHKNNFTSFAGKNQRLANVGPDLLS
jgi:hypothetical protein